MGGICSAHKHYEKGCSICEAWEKRNMSKLDEIEKRVKDFWSYYIDEVPNGCCHPDVKLKQIEEDMSQLIFRCRELEGACNNAIRALSEVELLYTRNPVICEALGKLYSVLEDEK